MGESLVIFWFRSASPSCRKGPLSVWEFNWKHGCPFLREFHSIKYLEWTAGSLSPLTLSSWLANVGESTLLGRPCPSPLRSPRTLPPSSHPTLGRKFPFHCLLPPVTSEAVRPREALGLLISESASPLSNAVPSCPRHSQPAFSRITYLALSGGFASAPIPSHLRKHYTLRELRESPKIGMCPSVQFSTGQMRGRTWGKGQGTWEDLTCGVRTSH